MRSFPVRCHDTYFAQFVWSVDLYGTVRAVVMAAVTETVSGSKVSITSFAVFVMSLLLLIDIGFSSSSTFSFTNSSISVETGPAKRFPSDVGNYRSSSRHVRLPRQTVTERDGHTGITYMVELDVPPYTSNTTPTIKFILNPQCTYTIIIQSSLVGVFRRVVLLYGTQVPTYITVHLLLTLAKQLKTMGESGECPSFFTSIVTLTPLAVVPFVKITNLIL
ncbi:hypothetical protein Pcinc_043204, partial [Petrolisthes cinctipes]